MPGTNYGADTLGLANDLAKFIKENKLTTNVQGKEFVNVEGWQYAGSRLGIVPIVQKVKNRSTSEEIKYEVQVTLFSLQQGVTVGAGFAICSNKEPRQKSNQEFAILSMAQTRAIGKAYRNILAWIIRAAGYEATPAEEMDYSTAPAAVPNVATPTGAAARITPAPAEAPAEPLVQPEVPASAPPVMVASTTPPRRVPTPGSAAAAVADRNARVQAAGILLSTGLQHQLIGALLQNPAIPQTTRSTALLNYLRFTHERAETCITRLVKTITEAGADLPANYAELTAAIGAEYEQLQVPGSRAEVEAQLRFLANANGGALGKKEVARLLAICVNPDYNTAKLREELEQGTSYLNEVGSSAA